MKDMLHLQFFGLFMISRAGQPITRFESNKVRGLLAFLAVEAGRPHSRDALAALLWPDWPDQGARSNLRYALADLRKTIGDQKAEPHYLNISRSAIQFNRASQHWLDTAEFDQLAGESVEDVIRQDRTMRLEQALELMQGEFLEGLSVADAAPFEDWLRGKRQQYARQRLEVLYQLAAAYEQQGNLAQAQRCARQQVEIEPWNEEAQGQLIRLLALDGQRSAALAQYEACKSALADDLGVRPGVEIQRLYESIRDGMFESHAGALTAEEDLPPAPGKSPYMGLQHFDEEDAALFMGREQLTAHLVHHLNQLGAARFLAVVGASGSGKSSLVRAGLVPAIRNWRELADGSSPPRHSHRWLVHVITPTAHPLEALASSLTLDAGSLSATTSLIDDLSRDPRSLQLYARRITSLKRAPHLLLVVDQFEEVFTMCRSETERGAFIENILTAAWASGENGFETTQPGNPSGMVTVIIALRADFYNHCALYSSLREALSQHQKFIGVMNQEELRRAIEEPAKRNDWALEPGLVDLILREADREPGSLPLLSHALLETWHRRRGRTLTLKGYSEAGGIHGAISRTAERVFTGLLPEQKDFARRIFLRLTELGEGTQDTCRRAQPDELLSSAEGADQVKPVINTLVEARLLTAEETSVQVAHEALIREWPRLRGWLNEDRESLRLHRHLTEAAQAWEHLDHDPGELYRGARLAQVLEWVALPENAAALNKQEIAFLRTSEELAEREETERETQRQRALEAVQRAAAADRERAEAERKHAESEQLRAEEQAQNAQRLRRRAVFLAGLLLLTLVMAGTALAFATRSTALAKQNAENARLADEQRNIAEGEVVARSTQQAITEIEIRNRQAAEEQALRERDIARARELVAASSNNLLNHGDPELSSRLALSSLEITYSQEAETVLRQALLSQRVVKVIRSENNSLRGLSSLDYSPEGERLVTSNESGQGVIWDAEQGKPITTLQGEHTGYTIFSPNGLLLAGYSDDGFVCVWSAASGEKRLELPVDVSWDSSLDFNPDGTLLAVPTDSGAILVWEMASSQQVASLTVHTSATWVARFSPDGKRLVTTSEDGSAIVWDTQTWQPVRTIVSETEPFTGAAFSPDGTRLALVNASAIIVQDFESGAEVLRVQGNGFDVDFSPDGTQLVTSIRGAGTLVLNAQTGEQLLSLPAKNPATRALAVFAPDGKHLATSSEDGTILIWDISPEGSREILTVSNPAGLSGRIDLAPDGLSFATSNFDGTVQIWDFATGRELRKIQAHQRAVWRVKYSPDGIRLLTAGEDSLVKVWDVASGQMVLTLEGHIDLPDYSLGGFFNGVYVASFSPNGSLIASGGEDGALKLWDANNGVLIQSLWVHPSHNGVSNLAFNRDGTLLAAVTEGPNPAVSLWQISGQTADEVFRKTGLTDDFRYLGLAFSPDNQIVFGSDEGVVRFLTTATEPTITQELADHTGNVSNVTFSADGKTLATTSRNGMVHIRDGHSGGLIKIISPGHNLRQITLSPDGRFLLTAGSDVVAQVFAVNTDDLTALARSRLTRGYTLEECRAYLHLERCPEE